MVLHILDGPSERFPEIDFKAFPESMSSKDMLQFLEVFKGIRDELRQQVSRKTNFRQKKNFTKRNG